MHDSPLFVSLEDEEERRQQPPLQGRDPREAHRDGNRREQVAQVGQAGRGGDQARNVDRRDEERERERAQDRGREQSQEDRLGAVERRQTELAARQERQAQQLRSLAGVQAASERMRQGYHRCSEALRNAFGPFKAAYDGQQAALTARARRIESQRMAFIELFFVGLGGTFGGAVQQGIRSVIGDQLRHVAAATAAGDIAKYVTRLAPHGAFGRDPQRPSSQPDPAGAQTQAPRAAPAPGERPHSPTTAPEGSPQQGTPQGQDQATPNADPISSRLDPSTWLQSTLAILDRIGGDVSTHLTELCIRLARGDEAPPDALEPIAFVNRLLAPVEAIATLPVHTPQQYSQALWTQWLTTHWLVNDVRTMGTPDGVRSELERAYLADRGLWADIRALCGSDAPLRQVMAAHQAQADRRQQQQQDDNLRRRGVVLRPRT